MNSLTFPRNADELTLSAKKITPGEARQFFLKYKDDYKSYIGYPDTALMLANVLDSKVELSRDDTIVKDGDVILAVRLIYRVQPRDKKFRASEKTKPENYEFYKVIIKEG
jgi:hypothetical protein